MKSRVRIEQTRWCVACVEESFVLELLVLEACPELLSKDSRKKNNTQFMKSRVRIEQTRWCVACVEESFVLELLVLEACPELLSKDSRKRTTHSL